jgi:integrase
MNKTINAMISWLHKRSETYIDGFDFAKVKAQDKGDYANRRGIFTDAEIDAITDLLKNKIKKLRNVLDEENNATTYVALCFSGLLLITGMRIGELLELKWSRIRLLMKLGRLEARKAQG